MKNKVLKSVVIILSVFILLVATAGILIGCSSTKPTANIDMTKLKDGDYEGASFKFPGKMTVAMTVKEGKITAIRVTKQAALKKYTNMLDPLIESIIAKQSINVDDVTGATISCRAMKRAVEDALLKATGGSAE